MPDHDDKSRDNATNKLLNILRAEGDTDEKAGKSEASPDEIKHTESDVESHTDSDIDSKTLTALFDQATSKKKKSKKAVEELKEEVGDKDQDTDKDQEREQDRGLEEEKKKEPEEREEKVKKALISEDDILSEGTVPESSDKAKDKDKDKESPALSIRVEGDKAQKTDREEG